MAPFFTGIAKSFGSFGLTGKKRAFPVRFYIELFGGQGQDFGINDNGNPAPADSNPSRRGGNGGYTKIDMTVPTAYILDINSPVSSYSGGGGSGSPSPGSGGLPGAQIGGDSAGFSINGEWMAITGGGGGATGNYNFNFLFSPAFLFISPGPAGGVGGGAISAGPPPGSAGSVGGFGYPSVTPNPNGQSGALSGGGGGGAAGGTGGSGQNAGQGGGANIRIKYETNSLSGPLAPIGFPDITMSYITGTDGGNPRGSGNRLVITNYNTNNNYTVSSGSVPVEFINSL